MDESVWLVMNHPAFKPRASVHTLHWVLPKRLGRSKRHLVPHPVITRPGQLVRHRLVRHWHGGFRLLALVIALDARMQSYSKVGRFRIGPGQVRMAIFHIALPLAFPVAHFRAVHTATIRGI